MPWCVGHRAFARPNGLAESRRKTSALLSGCYGSFVWKATVTRGLHILILAGAFFALVLAVSTTMAQTPSARRAAGYPNKAIRFIVPFAPGGGADLLARVIGQKLSEIWNQSVVIENRTGSGGNIGTELVAKSAPDGYTLLLGITGTLAVNPHLYRKLPYDPVKDFAPVALVASAPTVLVVHPSVPAQSLKDFIALAKAKPRQLNYGSAGNGTAGHLAMELLKALAGIDLVHIPYKGAGQATIELLGGQVDVGFLNMLAVTPYVAAGRLRALAVTSVRRSPVMPKVPVVAETLPGYEAVGWFGVLVSAGTPGAIVTKLNEEIVRIVKMPDVRERLSNLGAEPIGSTPEQFAAYIKTELAKYAKIVKASGARAD